MTLHQPETLLAVTHRFMYGLEFSSSPSAIRSKVTFFTSLQCKYGWQFIVWLIYRNSHKTNTH